MLPATANEARCRRTRLLAVAAGVASAAFYLAVSHTPGRLNRMWFMVDLDVYRWSGTPVVSTSQLYTAKYSGFLSFTYTPFAAILFAPLHLVQIRVLRWVSAVANLAALGFSITVATSNASSASRVSTAARRNLSWTLFGACIWLEPVQQTLRFGQVNLFLMAAVLADLARPPQARWRGVFVGIAAGIKLTPAIFLLFLIVSGQRRAAIRGVAAATATAIAGWVILPRASYAFWIQRRFVQSSRVGNPQFVANQSIYGTIGRLLGGQYAVPSLYLPLAAALVIFGMRQAVRLHRLGHTVPALCCCGVTGLLVSPISWSHHWVWVVPLISWAASRAMHGHRRAALIAVGTAALFAAWPMHTGAFVTMPFGLIWLTPNPARVGRSWGIPWLTGNLYVFVALLAMVALELWLRHISPPGTANTPEVAPRPLNESGPAGLNPSPPRRGDVRATAAVPINPAVCIDGSVHAAADTADLDVRLFDKPARRDRRATDWAASTRSGVTLHPTEHGT
jgi:alpha-1,2-mannosyltransferase